MLNMSGLFVSLRTRAVVVSAALAVCTAAVTMPAQSHAAGLDFDTLNQAMSMDWSSPQSIWGNIVSLFGLGGGSSSDASPPAVTQDTTKTLLSEIPQKYEESLTPTGDVITSAPQYSQRLKERASYGGNADGAGGKALWDKGALTAMQSDYMQDPGLYDQRMYELGIRWYNTKQRTLDAVMAGQAKVLDGMQKHIKTINELLKKSNDETSLMAVVQYQNMILTAMASIMADKATLDVWNTKLELMREQDNLIGQLMAIDDAMVRASRVPKFVDNPGTGGR